MTDRDHVLPLAPATVIPVSDETTPDNKNTLRRRRKRIKCLICVSVTSLILLTIALTLAFTVFKVKEPIIKMNGVTINGLAVSMGGTQIGRLAANLTMIVDMSVKNPNSASFKYSNTTTDISYKGTVFGVARGPPGRAKAHRTVKMNMTVVFMADRLLSDPGLGLEVIGSGLLNMGSFTKVSGKVTIMGFVKKHVTVKMNCTMALNVTSQSVQDMECKRKINL